MKLHESALSFCSVLLLLTAVAVPSLSEAYTLRNPTVGVCIARNAANNDAQGNGCANIFAQITNSMRCQYTHETSTGELMKECEGRIQLAHGGCMTAVNATEINVRPCGAGGNSQIWVWEQTGLLYSELTGINRAVTIRKFATPNPWWIGFTGRVPGFPGVYQRWYGL